MIGKARALAVVAVLFGTAFCGKDSNTMTGPVNAAPMASVAGTWSGTYSSATSSCPAAPMTMTLAQNGNAVTGNFATNSCGPHGAFKATMSGNALTGSIDMTGCTGGSVSGHVDGGVLSLSVGDFYRPLVTTTEVLMEGGTATLTR
jgi:hypothetical protein